MTLILIDHTKVEGGEHYLSPFEAREMGSDNRPFVNGPVTGCNYDSGTLFPEMRLSSFKDAQAAAKIANAAFQAGIRHNQRQCARVMGLG